MKILTPTNDTTLNVMLDTVKKNKQALVFVNTKRSAEKVAEDMSKKCKNIILTELSEKVKNVLGNPTVQCNRLARCVLRGVAFHHAGLHQKQKDIVEQAFRDKIIKIIACTPTLAAGINLPAFRAIIRDLKRYAGRMGMRSIPILEYHQMAGRAGRPGHDAYGEAIVIASSDQEKEELHTRYILGRPEEIQSKLNVEPVMRTYVLSLLSSKIVQTKKQIIDFFKETFWAHQYGDMEKLEETIMKTLKTLGQWTFLEKKEERFVATTLGKRVAQLYLDPFTAHHLLKGIKRASSVPLQLVSFVQLACNTIEMWPLLSIRAKDYDLVQEKSVEFESYFLEKEPSMFDLDYEDWIRSIKTSLLFLDWCEECTEDYLLETYNVRPGELRTKLRTIEWLLYSMSELAYLLEKGDLVREIAKVRIRLKNGVKEELLPLLKLKSVGRVRARTMYQHGIKTPGDLKTYDEKKLRKLLGTKLSLNVLQQVGRETHEKIYHSGRLSDFV